MCAALHPQRDRILAEKVRQAIFSDSLPLLCFFFFFLSFIYCCLVNQSTCFHGAPLKKGYKLTTTTIPYRDRSCILDLGLTSSSPDIKVQTQSHKGEDNFRQIIIIIMKQVRRSSIAFKIGFSSHFFNSIFDPLFFCLFVCLFVFSFFHFFLGILLTCSPEYFFFFKFLEKKMAAKREKKVGPKWNKKKKKKNRISH